MKDAHLIWLCLFVLFTLCSFWPSSRTFKGKQAILSPSNGLTTAPPVRCYNATKILSVGKGGSTNKKNLLLGKAKTTLVIMGYSPKRRANWARILPAYGSMDSVLDRIIIIWNNQEFPPPAVPGNLAVPVVVLQAQQNSMNNRYNISVQTSSVLSADDDVFVTEPLIQRLVAEHVQEPNRLIGVDGRSYDSNGNYLFKQRRKLPTMVLTKTWILPTEFLVPYMADPDLLAFINTEKGTGCEDIAMNFVAKSCSGLDARVIPMNGRENLPEPDGLSIENNGWFRWFRNNGWPAKRTSCVRWMLNHFVP